ncbi:hypothetical protein [Streptomyces sp. NPDC101455]|uniref:hypothetical protein n=1 Tax=Streptomyces sp. NPDC101455 TaxID=3366142 RepID=UPI0038022541
MLGVIVAPSLESSTTGRPRDPNQFAVFVINERYVNEDASAAAPSHGPLPDLAQV